MIDKTITPGKILLSIAICLLLVSAGSLVTGCKQEPKAEDTKEVAEDANDDKFNESEARDDDSEYLVAAAESNLMEIELGKLALSKSTNADVKKYADMLVADHTKAMEELKSLAANLNVTLPTSITDKGKEHYNDLNEKTGKDFDQKFASMMADGHDDALDKMEKAVEKANSPAISTWAANVASSLKGHEQQAKLLQEKVK